MIQILLSFLSAFILFLPLLWLLIWIVVVGIYFIVYMIVDDLPIYPLIRYAIATVLGTKLLSIIYIELNTYFSNTFIGFSDMYIAFRILIALTIVLMVITILLYPVYRVMALVKKET